MDDITSFGYWVRRRRKALDLTQVTLAQRIGCSVVTIRKIERDERRPSLQIAELLANHLVIPAAEQKKFLQMARGKFVAAMPSPIEAVPFPTISLEAETFSKVDETLFVARDAELAQLSKFLDLSMTGHGHVAFVAGEAGLGKTALVQEFTRQALERQPDLVVASGYCNAYSGVGDPYLPFREILALLTGDVEARLMAGAISQIQAQSLWTLMPVAVQTLVKNSPDLIDTFVGGSTLVSRTLAAGFGGTSWLAQLEKMVVPKSAVQTPANLRQSDLFEQYAKLVQSLARRQAAVLVLDDLQWADTGSISLLFHLGRRLQGSRILIVGIYRPADVAIGRDGERHPLASVVNEFQQQFGNVQVDLRHTDGKQFVERLIDSQPNELGAKFREALHQHTSGHALFTIEMLRGMEERGDLVQNEAGRWIEGSNIDWETLPARVEGVIGERIGRLPTQLKEVLSIASVEGEDFTAEVIAQIRGVSEPEIIRQLSGVLDKQHRLVRGQISRQLDGRRLSFYRFRHILFQRYLYNNLDTVERSYLHQAVGNALENLYDGQTEEIAVALARHFEAAGDLATAVAYLHQAGKRAVHLSGNDEAITHFNHALELLDLQPSTPERIQQELDFQIALGAPLTATKGYGAPELEKAFNRARELTKQIGDAPQLFQVLYGLWAYHHVRAKLQLALELAEQMLNLAHRQANPSHLMVAHWAVGNTLFWMGEFILSQEHLEQSMALYDRRQHASHVLLYGQDQGVTCLSFQAYNLWYLGYPDRSLQKSEEALGLARELGHPYSQVYAAVWNAYLYLKRREWQASEKQARAVIALSKKHGFPFWVAVANRIRGSAMARLGQAEEGVRLVRQGIDDFRSLGAQVSQPQAMGSLAGAYREAGHFEDGLAVLAEALAAVEITSDAHWEADLYRVKGELLYGQGADDTRVKREFSKAIDIARKQKTRSLELRAQLSLSYIRQRQGEIEEARRTLAEIYEWFTEGFDTPDLQEARTLLDELS